MSEDALQRGCVFHAAFSLCLRGASGRSKRSPDERSDIRVCIATSREARRRD